MMAIINKLTVPDWVRSCLQYETLNELESSILQSISRGLENLNPPDPIISIILPAYNEERFIVKTLASLSRLNLKYPTELIVANNNSTDLTQTILDALGVKCVFVKQQGVTYARQAALEQARGIYVLSADADSIYPETWGQALVEALKQDETIACAYGRYAFVPSKGKSRAELAFHEMGTDLVTTLRMKSRPYFNVMGCNCAYRKSQALSLGGYNHFLFHQNGNRGEDGYMALQLAGCFGSIQYVKAERVWTSDRRLTDGNNMTVAIGKRIKRYLLNDFNPFIKHVVPSMPLPNMTVDNKNGIIQE